MYQVACRTGCNLEWILNMFFFLITIGFHNNTQEHGSIHKHAVCWIQIFRSYFHTHLKPWVDSFSPFVIHNKEGATFVHGALKNASQDTHTHSFPSPCSPPNSPSLSLPSIWISCHLDTLRVNMDACMCAKVTYFSSQRNIIKSWVHPPLLLVYCLALRFCWLCVCVCVFWCALLMCAGKTGVFWCGHACA